MNQAAATTTPVSLRAPRRMFQSVRNATAGGEISAAHQRSARTMDVPRPAKSSRTRAARIAARRRPRRDTALGPDALPGEPADDFAPGGVQRLRIRRLEAEHEDRLGIRGTEQSPAPGEGDPDAVNGVD